CTRPPCLRSCSAAAEFFAGLVPQIHTAAPAAARPSAIPSPIPLLPPVTSATLPLRSNARKVIFAARYTAPCPTATGEPNVRHARGHILGGRRRPERQIERPDGPS